MVGWFLSRKLDYCTNPFLLHEVFWTLALYPCSNGTIVLWSYSVGVQCFSYPQQPLFPSGFICSPYVAQLGLILCSPGLSLTHGDPPISASWVQRLQAWNTTLPYFCFSNPAGVPDPSVWRASSTIFLALPSLSLLSLWQVTASAFTVILWIAPGTFLLK